MDFQSLESHAFVETNSARTRQVQYSNHPFFGANLLLVLERVSGVRLFLVSNKCEDIERDRHPPTIKIANWRLFCGSSCHVFVERFDKYQLSPSNMWLATVFSWISLSFILLFHICSVVIWQFHTNKVYKMRSSNWVHLPNLSGWIGSVFKTTTWRYVRRPFEVQGPKVPFEGQKVDNFYINNNLYSTRQSKCEQKNETKSLGYM